MNKKKDVSKYDTLALSEKHKIDPKTKASHPSEINVEEARDWSIEEKL